MPQHVYKGCVIILQFKNTVSYWEARKAGRVVAKAITRKECEQKVDRL